MYSNEWDPSARSSARIPNEQYLGVQYLRFISALLVVVCHSTLVVSERFPEFESYIWRKGAVGVDLFFVISGFVIVLAGYPLRNSASGWKFFASRRIIRIVPMYWIATTIKLLALIVVPTEALHSHLVWAHVISSYLFLPVRNAFGEIEPIHAVGWTLTLEIFFYAVFCLALFLRKSPTRFVFLLFSALICWGVIDPLFSQSWSVLIYTKPLIILFFLGMLIALFTRSGARLPRPFGLAFIFIGIVLIWHFDVLTGWSAFFMHGVPSALIVAGVVMLEPWIGMRKLRLPLLLGESSYALYLFHPFVLNLVGIILTRARWISSACLIALVMCISAILVSLVLHVILEVPLTRGLKRFLQLQGQARVLASFVSTRSSR